MCLAIPGKIMSIDKNEAILSYPQEIRKARIQFGNFKEGDYVIAQAGIVIEKIPADQAEAMLEMLK